MVTVIVIKPRPRIGNRSAYNDLRRHGVLSAIVLTMVMGAGPAQAVGASRPSGKIHVVAAENFWGNIAQQLGGRDVSVTSLISNPNADPHLFESDAADAATLAQARVVIENGVGYDTFMRNLLSADDSHPSVITAANVLHVSGSDPNPHLWYDIPAVPKMAGAISGALTKVDPGDAALFRQNLSRFDASLAPLNATMHTIRERFSGAPVAYTERVPGYVLSLCHLTVKTPIGFARAIEDGVDPGPGDTLAMQQLITTRRIDVLLYNNQTVTSVTAQLRTLAMKHGIPVIGVSETMPLTAHSYQAWQETQLQALLHALERND
jgi:zinc/manganese transport system substrate-binding protein